MYDAVTIKAGLIGLVGWRQNPDGTGTQLTSLITSSSGLWFNDSHPLLTFDNIQSVAPQFSGFNLTTWLQQKTEAGIIAAVEDWIQAKFEVRTAKSLLESERLFDTAGDTSHLDANDAKTVGMEIIPPRVRGVKATIERVGLQFDTAQNITIQLFRNGTAAYIQTTTVTYTTPNDVQWVNLDWEIDGHGAYYLVYSQVAIVGQSINGIYDYAAGRVYSPSDGRYLYNNYYPVGRYLQVTPFSNPGALNPKDNAYTLATNYGLNIEFHIQCDYTDFVIRHADILKGLIQKRVAMDMLREIAYNANARVNRNEKNATIDQVLYEIDGNAQVKGSGLKHRYDMELQAALMDHNAIDPVCAPCRRRAVKYRVV